MRAALQIVEADVDANVFLTLGAVEHSSMGDARAEFRLIPRGPDDSPFILDLLNANGDIIADKSLAEATVRALLDLEAARSDARAEIESFTWHVPATPEATEEAQR